MEKTTKKKAAAISIIIIILLIIGTIITVFFITSLNKNNRGKKAENSFISTYHINLPTDSMKCLKYYSAGWLSNTYYAAYEYTSESNYSLLIDNAQNISRYSYASSNDGNSLTELLEGKLIQSDYVWSFLNSNTAEWIYPDDGVFIGYDTSNLEFLLYQYH